MRTAGRYPRRPDGWESIMIELLDQQQSLAINQWKIFTAVILSIMLDFFDFLLIGFVLAFFVQDWHLTYGQIGPLNDRSR
jgi:hypothetical protein